MMDPTLSSTSSMAASYEAGQPPSVQDPMELTIQETVDKLNGIKNDVGEMGSRISYLRDIRPRALQLLAQADAADEEAARLEQEKNTLDKEVDRLKSIIMRMEDMRFATRQLTGQMQLDTALQMRHILENGKSIVPRHPPNPRIKRSISDDGSSESSPHGPVFKMPRRDPPRTDSTTPTNGGGMSSSMGHSGASSSPSNNTMHNFSPSRGLSLTPGATMANYAAGLSGNEGGSNRGSGQAPFMDVPPLPSSNNSGVGSAPGMHATSSPSGGFLPPSGTPPITGQPIISPSLSYSFASYTQPSSSPVSYSGGGGGGTGMYSNNSLATAMSLKEEDSYHLSGEYTDGPEDTEDFGGRTGRDVLFR